MKHLGAAIMLAALMSTGGCRWIASYESSPAAELSTDSHLDTTPDLGVDLGVDTKADTATDTLLPDAGTDVLPDTLPDALPTDTQPPCPGSDRKSVV